MRYAFTGGRDYTDRDSVTTYLRENVRSTDVVIVGCCPTGVDLFVRVWTLNRNWPGTTPLHVYAANWAKYGKSAGPIRNSTMLREGKPDKLVAFPGGRGTADCVRQAQAAGIPVEFVNATR